MAAGRPCALGVAKEGPARAFLAPPAEGAALTGPVVEEPRGR